MLFSALAPARCVASDCDRLATHIRRTLCKPCYDWLWWRDVDATDTAQAIAALNTRRRTRLPRRTEEEMADASPECEVPGCHEPRVTRHLCKRHYGLVRYSGAGAATVAGVIAVLDARATRAVREARIARGLPATPPQRKAA